MKTMIAMSLHDFSEKLRVFRAQHKLSQVEFGKLIGVGIVAISNWENEKVVPTADNYLKALELFENYEGKNCHE